MKKGAEAREGGEGARSIEGGGVGIRKIRGLTAWASDNRSMKGNGWVLQSTVADVNTAVACGNIVR